MKRAERGSSAASGLVGGEGTGSPRRARSNGVEAERLTEVSPAKGACFMADNARTVRGEWKNPPLDRRAAAGWWWW